MQHRRNPGERPHDRSPQGHNEVAIRERLQLAYKAGDLPKWLSVDDYIRYISMLGEVKLRRP